MTHPLLIRGLDELGLTLSPTVQAQLIEYCKLIQAWNHTHNLTAIDDLDQMISKHLLDSLTLLNFF